MTERGAGNFSLPYDIGPDPWKLLSPEEIAERRESLRKLGKSPLPGPRFFDDPRRPRYDDYYD